MRGVAPSGSAVRRRVRPVLREHPREETALLLLLRDGLLLGRNSGRRLGLLTFRLLLLCGHFFLLLRGVRTGADAAAELPQRLRIQRNGS